MSKNNNQNTTQDNKQDQESNNSNLKKILTSKGQDVFNSNDEIIKKKDNNKS